MACVTYEIDRCEECHQLLRMIYVNRKRNQRICDLCVPKVKQRKISEAIEFLIANGVTFDELKKLFKKKR